MRKLYKPFQKDDGVFLGECGRDFAPCLVCFWMAVDKQ